METLLSSIRAAEADYVPADDISDRLRQKHTVLTALIGPFGTGKSTLIHRIVRDDPDFGRVKSFTTRPRRERSERRCQYDFRKHDVAELTKLANQVENGHLLQFAVAPFNDRVYGSYVRDYTKPYMLLDALASSVPQLERLPFDGLHKIALVSPVLSWKKMSAGRFRELDHAEITGRLQEGRDSLAWSLEQGDGVSWVSNQLGVDTVPSEIAGIARGHVEPNPANRAVGEELYRHLGQLLAA